MVRTEGPRLSLVCRPSGIAAGKIDIENLRVAAEAALANEGLTGPIEASLSIVSDSTIRRLNARHRRVSRSTDVLSFPLLSQDDFVAPPDGIAHLGDVVISLSKAEKQARHYDHSVQEEMELLMVHGVLHLLNYRDYTDDEKRVMRTKEEAALARAKREMTKSSADPS